MHITSGLFSKENTQLFAIACAISMATFLFSTAYHVVFAETESLSVTINSTLTFSATTDAFANLTPGSAKFATTTLNVATNNTAGWNMTLYGVDQSPSDTVLDLSTDAAVGITDQAEWIPGAATTSAGNAVRIGSLDNSGDVLAFRVMTASGSAPFRSTTWWGTADNYTDSASTLWAGIASSTNLRQIGNAGAGSYSSSQHLSTVIYYLDVAATQQTGSYSGDLVYTATAN
jgi:hypothetical protein